MGIQDSNSEEAKKAMRLNKQMQTLRRKKLDKSKKKSLKKAEAAKKKRLAAEKKAKKAEVTAKAEEKDASSGLSSEAAKKKIKSTLRKYQNIEDKNEAVLCFQEMGKLADAATVSEIVLEMVLNSAPKDERKRKAMAELLVYLQSKKILTATDVKTGIDRLAEFMDDIKIDIPMAPKFFDTFIATLGLAK